MATNNVINTTNPIIVSQGGTGQSSFTANAVLIGNGTGVINSTLGTNNQILAGTASTDPVFTSTGIIYLSSITINSGTSLNKYSTGTFNPIFDSSGTKPTATYNYQIGRYTRIGNKVIVVENVSAATLTNTPSGTAYITGLPFTINFNAGDLDTGNIIFQNTLLIDTYYNAQAVTNSAATSFAGSLTGGGSALNASSFTASSIFTISFNYEV